MASLSPIQEFYKDSTVLLTGATGFVGKAIIDKLLRYCQDIKRIYILVRPKKGLTTKERLEKMWENNYFNKLKKENPKYREYITVLDGDIQDDILGLSEDHLNIIINEVNVILHVAATVRFDEKIRIATKLNIVATKKVMELSNQCKNLKSIVHVSTAYSHSYKNEIKEEFYEPLRDPEEFIEFVNNTSDELLEQLTPSIIQEYPNTYTYSKGLAEDIIKKRSKGLPLSIVRPSIVMGPWIEPIPGWMDNFSGPFGIMAGIGAGLLRVLYVKMKKRADLVPVDMTASTIIAASWANAQKEQEITPAIYHIVTGQQNPTFWEDFMTWGGNLGGPYASIKAVWHQILITTNHMYLFQIYKFLLHTIPAYTCDFLMRLVGKEPVFVKLYDKIHKGIKVLTYFLTNEWSFHDDNCRKLYLSLDEKDKKMFNFDVTRIEWDLYYVHSIRNIRIVLLNDPITTTIEAQEKRQRFQYGTYGILIALIVLFYFLFTTIFRLLF